MRAPVYCRAQLQTLGLAGEWAGCADADADAEEQGTISFDGTLMSNEDELDALLSSTDALLNGGAPGPEPTTAPATAAPPFSGRVSGAAQAAVAKITGEGGLLSMASEYLPKRMLQLGTREYQNVEKECRRLHLLTPAEQGRLRALRKRARGSAGKQRRKSLAGKPRSPGGKTYKETCMDMFAQLGPIMSG